MAKVVATGIQYHVTQRGNRRQQTFSEVLIFHHGREVSLSMYEICGIESGPGDL